VADETTKPKRGVQLIIMSDAEHRALREVLVLVREAAARGQDPDFDELGRAAMRSAWWAARKDVFDRGLAAFDRSVRWDRAGRVYFGLSPACAQALTSALERTRPMWDDARRGTKHVRWFLRRLRSSK
jgi:hypothetical protein